VVIFSHLQAEDRAKEAGADAYLTKPLDEALLIETVERLVALKNNSAGDEA
jgi:CheY-like chemotaxis protein